MDHLIYCLPITAVLMLGYAAWRTFWVLKQPTGTTMMQRIAHAIATGADAFLKAEYRMLAFFVALMAPLLYYISTTSQSPLSPWWLVGSFLVGAFFAALAGFMGMRIATRANVRTTQAAQYSLPRAFYLAFTGGSVMGMGVAGLAILGISGLLLLLLWGTGLDITSWQGLKNSLEVTHLYHLLEALTGFALGAESVALFARVAGGIYTKAADVGADLVGKLEAGIPEDDPRNPAVIADNVGDNVGDVAGMGADLFGSYASTILAAMVLGCEVMHAQKGTILLHAVWLPLAIGAIGGLLSAVVMGLVRIRTNKSDVGRALHFGNALAIVLTVGASWLLIEQLLPTHLCMRGIAFGRVNVFYSVLIGLGVGLLMSWITGYFTDVAYKPVRFIINQSLTGAATNVIAGLSVGMLSTVLPILLFAGGIYSAFACAGFYGVAMAAAGMMATTAMQLAIDAFGPIADNAGGIAEMSGLPKLVRNRTDVLDTVGNTTAATGKGFAIGSAALTSLALFAAFTKTAHIQGVDVCKANVLAGLFVGGMLPFLFSALAMRAVGQAAMAMVEEVRRQFREMPGLLKGEGVPAYDRCIRISTEASLYAMLLPGIIALVSPIVIGLMGGAEVLGGFLAGVTVSGSLMALFQSNAGGAWDNAKKAFEKGVVIQGHPFQKGSKPHQAAVTGDTVGDPCKDTSGPAMNILIKLTAIVALTMAPYIAVKH